MPPALPPVPKSHCKQAAGYHTQQAELKEGSTPSHPQETYVPPASKEGGVWNSPPAPGAKQPPPPASAIQQ